MLFVNDGNNGKLKFGASQDLQIYHDGSNSYIDQTGTGDLIIRTSGTDKKIIFYAEAGGSVVEYLSIGGSNELTKVSKDFRFIDSTKARFGTGDDMQIFHDSANSYIETSSTSAGDLYIKSQGTGHDLYLQATDDIFIRPQGGNNGIKVIGQAAVELYYNNVKKFETTSTGVSVTGNVILGTGDNLYLNGTTGLRILHDGSNALFINQTAGDIKIQNSVSNKDIIFKGVDGASSIDALTLDMSEGGAATFAGNLSANVGSFNSPDASESILMNLVANNGNNAATFRTTASGHIFEIRSQNSGTIKIDSTTTTFTGDVSLGDAKKITFGAAPDYEIYHNNTTNVNHISSLIDRQLSINANIINLTNQANNSTYLQLASTGATFAEAVTIQKSSLSVGNGQTSGVTEVGLINKDTSLVDAGDIQNRLRMRGLYYSGSDSLLVETQICSGHESADGNGNSFLALYTQSGGSSPTEKVRIASNGVLSAANGIALGVGLNNTASNVLDDYEEGTWTPTIKDLGGNLATLSTANGSYTKIGRVVVLNYQVELSSKGSMTGNYVHLGGLPF